MNSRIEKLRRESLDAVATISSERAELLTKFYKTPEAARASIPVQRGLAFRYIMENKALYIGEGELIVGERGEIPKATPTYPEICSHSMQDLEILDTREKVSFKVNDHVKDVYEKEMIPFWKGRSLRDKIFDALDDNWKRAYSAGVFTEFQEQRAPGHTVCGDKIYKKGFRDLQKEIAAELENLDFHNDSSAFDKREELIAMNQAAEGIIAYAERYAAELKRLAEIETDPERKVELETMAATCAKVPAAPPETFWEALQCYWFVHLGVITEYNTWDSFNPGRLDQHLYPFYKREVEAGTLTEERAKELLRAFWVKFNNQPAPPKVGVTAKESSTYTDFCLINVGGLKRDGSDAVNEMSYIILDIIEEMKLLQPSSMVQLSKKNPDRFIKRAVKVVKRGYGQPSIFNTDTLVQQMVRHGKAIEDARDGGASGCVETGAFGREAYFLTGYFNLTKILELTLHNGINPVTGEQIGIKTGSAADFESFEQLMEAFEKQLNYFVDIKIKGNNLIESFYSRLMPAPFLSLLIDDCIANGKDYNAGGARYNTSYIQGVGVGTITDSLSSIKKHIFEDKTLTMDKLFEILDADFEGFEDIHKMFLNDTPKYGNDDDYADSIATDVFEIFFNAVDGRPNFRGGYHRINLLPTTVHVYFGSVLGALPDGKRAGKPISEGISPVQGTDRNGPTAVIKSAGKLDHLRTGGTLLNQKFAPEFFDDDVSIGKLAQFVRSYFRMDGHHIQFNVVTADLLRKAQKEPEKYPELIVRVAGYSDYFNDLGVELQNEIIRRTEHQGF